MKTVSDKLVITVDLKSSYMQHAILFTQGLVQSANAKNELYWVQNVKVYIGNSEEYTSNAACSDRPFMSSEDLDNSYSTNQAG